MSEVEVIRNVETYRWIGTCLVINRFTVNQEISKCLWIPVIGISLAAKKVYFTFYNSLI